MIRMKLMVVVTSVWLALAGPTLTFADPIYRLNVNVVQVFDDVGVNGTPLGPSNDNFGYLYQSAVNEIWGQAGIQVNFSVTTWNSSAAQRLTAVEMDSLFTNTFAGAPAVATDALQIFFVNDHPGTGYDGTVGSGWVGNPLNNPALQARNAGINQLYIQGIFDASNGRGVMTNEGFAREDLAQTLAHEIGHGLGLRHVDEMPANAGSIQDPRFTLSVNTPNLMWSAGQGPAYNFALNNDPNLTVLQENARLNPAQIAAAIYNGSRLDPDGNGRGVLRLIAVPEPSATVLWLLGAAVALHRRRSARGS